MLSAEDQEALTRVGPGTPAGELLRRYWHPVAGSAQLAPGSARPVRLLGEDLALFRSPGGDLGLLAGRCPHRGAALARGVVECDGLRCPYHGWKFDPTGRCLEAPAEAAGGAAGAPARAHPVSELGGLIFAYLGPAPAPLLPRWDLLVWDGVLRDVGWAVVDCNWLQIMENSVDPVHVEWLHGHHLAAMRGGAGSSYYRRRHVKIGFDVFRWGIIKRRVLEGGSEQDDDWRIGHPLVFPTMVRVGAAGQHRLQIRVPIDDTRTLHLWYACYRPPAGRRAPAQAEVPVYEVPWRDPRGDFILDFVDGQDIMTWVTQGPIADRTREHLVSSDAGIALFRRLLREQIARVAAGEDPMGTIRDAAENTLIELPQEHDKLGGGERFLSEALALSHVRYSPIRDQIAALFRPADGS